MRRDGVRGRGSYVGGRTRRWKRQGDGVLFRTGRGVGNRGTGLARGDDRHVTVEGIKVGKKHTRPNPMTGATGGIVNKVMPIDQSNVMLVNPATGKGERVGFKEVDGQKVRVFKSDGSIVGATA